MEGQQQATAIDTERPRSPQDIGAAFFVFVLLLVVFFLVAAAYSALRIPAAGGEAPAATEAAAP